MKAAESHLGGVEADDRLVTHDRGGMVDAAWHVRTAVRLEKGGDSAYAAVVNQLRNSPRTARQLSFSTTAV